MQIKYIAGYKFIPLNELDALRHHFLEKCQQLSLKGTILLSNEGININLAGKPSSIDEFVANLKLDQRFNDMSFRVSHTDFIPYRRMKVKIKKEIITLRQDNVKPSEQRAPSIKPEVLKQWLDENRDITILDTRNDYEIRFGAFKNAVNLHLEDFSEIVTHTDQITKDKPVVMYCTGGIRCEKAAIHLMNEGFPEVYQLDGGILNYFETVGGEHYEGGCFVFDERITLDAQLNTMPLTQCGQCFGPAPRATAVCPTCLST